MVGTVMYRYHATFYDGEVRINMRELPIIRETKCGAWVDDYGQPRFILYDTKKKYAGRTPEEALESFKAKKQRQLSILAAQHDRIKRTLDMLERGVMNESEFEYVMCNLGTPKTFMEL